MTRREFMGTMAGVASVGCVSRGEGVSPLRVAGILPAWREQDFRATEDTGERPSPRRPGLYPGAIVPLGDIRKQSKWSG